MKINIIERLKNKTFVISAVSLIVAFIYRFLSLIDIVPTVTETAIIENIGMFINILAFFGVLIDPTTKGINDSERAMTYGTIYDERLLEGKENE